MIAEYNPAWGRRIGIVFVAILFAVAAAVFLFP
jgi:hypothetical protein